MTTGRLCGEIDDGIVHWSGFLGSGRLRLSAVHGKVAADAHDSHDNYLQVDVFDRDALGALRRRIAYADRAALGRLSVRPIIDPARRS